MKIKKMNLLLAMTVVTSFSCRNTNSIQGYEAAIKQFSETWEENGSSGNRIANVDLFTDDGILIRSGKVYSGKEEIREFLTIQEANINFIHQEMKQVKSWSSKDFFMSVGVRTIDYIDSATGDTISISVPAVNIFERQEDGSVKLACSMKDSN
jgi:ketosteroid isomerase-like protein